MMRRPAARRRSARACWVGVALAGVAAAGTARAEPVAAVVEMFTSQGCTPCRAAEPVMQDLVGRAGVIALTLPVTYWDYLGWKDTLATRPFTERQRAYARARGGRQVFTPQAVIDGGATAVGSDRHALDRLVREAAQRNALAVPVRGELRGDRIVVEVGATADRAARGEVWLLPVLRSRTVSIRAEGAARDATYVNVVRGIHRLGSWTGQAAHFEAPSALSRTAEADGWVVLLQAGADGGRPGRILGAAKGPGL